MYAIQIIKAINLSTLTPLQGREEEVINRPTAEKANFESLIGLVFNLLSVKLFDKNRKI